MLGVDVYYVDLLIFVVTHPDANAERQIIIIISRQVNMHHKVTYLEGIRLNLELLQNIQLHLHVHILQMYLAT